MEIKDVNNIIQLCVKNNINIFEYVDSDIKIMIKIKKKENSKDIIKANDKDNKIEFTETKQEKEIKKEQEIEQSNEIIIKSKFIGIIEFSPELEAASSELYVEKDTVLGTIEAMKMFNEIKAPVSGYVRKLIENKAQVEYDETLFAIRNDKNV